MYLYRLFLLCFCIGQLTFAQQNEQPVILDDSEIEKQDILEEDLETYKADDDFNYVEVKAEESKPLDSHKIVLQDEIRLQRFGALAVIGCLLAITIGYGLASWLAPPIRYLERVSVIEAENQNIDTLSQTPTIVIDANQQVEAIYLKDDEVTVHCAYHEQVTLCY